MPTPPVSLWTIDDRECLLLVVEGRYELHLRVKGRTTRLQTCRDERAARLLAAEWQKAADTLSES
jgi:hypothetical protein